MSSRAVRLDSAEGFREQRFDFSVLRGKPTRTSQGFLRIDANLTRVGVLSYTRPDGSVQRELRHPDEVFKADSLRTMANAPVTDLHPSGLIDPKNVAQFRRGHVTESVRQDGKFVAAAVIIEDAALIAAVEAGDRKELSPGYTARMYMTPGIWEGQPYDAVQRDIVYNHAALGPKGWGRSGSEVALRMDSGLVSYEPKSTASNSGNGDAELYKEIVPSIVGTTVRKKLEEMGKSCGHLAESLGKDVWSVESFIDGYWDAFKTGNQPRTGMAHSKDFAPIEKFVGMEAKSLFNLVPAVEKADGGEPNQKRKTMETITVRIDGVDIEISKAFAPLVQKAITDRDSKITEVTKRADEVQAKLDAEKVRADVAQKLADETKVKLDAADAPERIAGLVAERVALEANARKILGAEAKFDGKDKAAIVAEVIKKVDPEFKTDGRSADYLQSRFDQEIANADKAQARNDSRKETARTALRVVQGDPEVKADAIAARDAAAERGRNAWKTEAAAK